MNLSYFLISFIGVLEYINSANLLLLLLEIYKVHKFNLCCCTSLVCIPLLFNIVFISDKNILDFKDLKPNLKAKMTAACSAYSDPRKESIDYSFGLI